MKSASVPTPPDPVATANAQTASNVKTATTQQQLNMVDQSNPYGSLTYTQSGTWADGTPKFAANTTLSEAEQAKLTQQNTFDDLVNKLGISQTEKLTGLLDKPIQMGNEATESRLMELGSARLNPALEQRRKSTETDLLNRGIVPGTEAYSRAMEAVTQGENDAYNQLLLTGRGQANQEILTERNQPINEITALLSGGQVNYPSFGSTPQTSVSGTDIAGLTMDAYKYGPLAQYQADQANKTAMMSGLFKLGSSALGGWAMSDRRVKNSIRVVGSLDNGLPVYAFKYNGSPTTIIGLMADDVEAVHPDAVVDVSGYKAVNYDKAVL